MPSSIISDKVTSPFLVPFQAQAVERGEAIFFLFSLVLSPLSIVAVIDKAIYMHLAAAIGTANETSLA